ncbi:hypothetical protein ACU4GI_21845 [Cupriavidus basilensis]
MTVTDGTNTSTMNAAGFSTPTGTVQSKDISTTGENYLRGTAASGTPCTVDGSTRTNANGTGLVVCGNNIWQAVGTAVANITAGMACGTNSQIATSGTNVGYICRGGKYQLLASAFGTMTAMRKIENVTDGMTFTKDNCPGGTPWALYTGKVFQVNVTGYIAQPIQAVWFTAIDSGSYWTAQAMAMAGTSWVSGNQYWWIGGTLSGTLTTGCAY